MGVCFLYRGLSKTRSVWSTSNLVVDLVYPNLWLECCHLLKRTATKRTRAQINLSDLTRRLWKHPKKTTNFPTISLNLDGYASTCLQPGFITTINGLLLKYAVWFLWRRHTANVLAWLWPQKASEESKNSSHRLDSPSACRILAHITISWLT